MAYIIEHEGYLGLFKGIGPQLIKGLLVQGLLMMTKEEIELGFVFLFAYLKTARQKQLAKAAEALKAKTLPVAEKAVQQAKSVMPVQTK